MAEAPTILTTPKTGKTLQGMFLPGIAAWIADESRLKLFDKSRRVGATYGEAYDATSTRFRPTQPRDQDYWFSSTDDSAAAEFIEYCRFFSRDLFGRAADYFTEQVEDPDTKRTGTSFCIRCPNGKRITAMTSNPRRFRSKGGDVCLDEFAHHDDGGAMYTAAEPSTKWGGTVRVISTHNGEDSEFNRFVQRCCKVLVAMKFDPDNPPREDAVSYGVLRNGARSMGLTPYLSYHRMTIVDAVGQGLVELINRSKGTSFTREEFLQDCRDSSRDEDSHSQEYMCKAAMGDAVWLPYHVIELCEDDGCAAYDGVLDGYGGGMCSVGIDVGRKHDLTVVWVLEEVGDVQWTRQVLRLEQMTFPDQEREIEALLRGIKFSHCAIDESGHGIGLLDYLKRTFGGSIEGVNFTPKNKEAMAVRIKGAFQDRHVRIPDDRSIREALHKMRKTTTATGLIRFDAPRDSAGHSDEFWALALALEAGSDVTGPREYLSAGRLAFARDTGGLL